MTFTRILIQQLICIPRWPKVLVHTIHFLKLLSMQQLISMLLWHLYWIEILPSFGKLGVVYMLTLNNMPPNDQLVRPANRSTIPQLIRHNEPMCHIVSKISWHNPTKTNMFTLYQRYEANSHSLQQIWDYDKMLLKWWLCHEIRQQGIWWNYRTIHVHSICMWVKNLNLPNKVSRILKKHNIPDRS